MTAMRIKKGADGGRDDEEGTERNRMAGEGGRGRKRGRGRERERARERERKGERVRERERGREGRGKSEVREYRCPAREREGCEERGPSQWRRS